jgi:hypothetical protein
MKFLQFIVRLAKFTVGVLLIPACFGATRAFYQYLLGEIRSQVMFLWGFGVFLLIFVVFQKPIRTYVFGHELTHALWILLFRGDVTAFSASAKGGKVEGTKANFFIALSPYFFPLYTLLLIAVYYAARLFWNVEEYIPVFVLLIGFTWAFHVMLTISVLIKGQPDIKKNGYLFSLTIIYFMNIVLLGVVLVFISPEFDWGDLREIFTRNVLDSYGRFREGIALLIREIR